MDAVADNEIDDLMEKYKAKYIIATDDIQSVRYQACRACNV